MDKSDCVEETFKQYEDQLLLLFKNCDTNKTGHLTAAEFNELLNVLQLDRSYKEQLLTVLSSNKTVTFGQFKNSLLDIICSSSNEVKREISPEREVSPKLVVGAKKYGRRSKPESSEEEPDHLKPIDEGKAMENDEHHFSTNIEFSRLNEMHCAQTSFDEMFPQLTKRGSRDSPLSLISPLLEVHGLVDNNIKAGYIHYDTLQELWESQGVLNGASLLRMLGIEPGTEASIDQLSVLLEELRQSDTSNTQVLIASLCLAQLQNKLIKSHLEQLMFERDKLRTDVSHANKRASLIAAEIDENYTKIESSIQTQIKLVEDKHAEAMKQLNEALNAEREQLVALSVKYEAEVSRYQESIAELTNEMAEKQKHHDKLASDYKALLEETSQLERNSHLNKEQQQEISLLKRKVQYLESTNESLLEFEHVVSTLRSENTMLRDRNDEISIELENALRKCKQYCESGGLSIPECSPPLSVSGSPLSSKNLSPYYEESRLVGRNLQLELPSDNPLLEPDDTEEDENNFVTFIKQRSPLHSDSIELQFNTFQNEIQKLLSEKRLCDEENLKLKKENVALKTQLTQISGAEVDTNLSDENKLKSSQSPGTLNLKSFAFDISLDSLTSSTNSKTRNELKTNNTMETCVNHNNNDLKMNTDDHDGEDQFKTMTIHKAIDDEHNVMETMILDKNGDDLTSRHNGVREANENRRTDAFGCEEDSLNTADEEMCVVKQKELTSAEPQSNVQKTDEIPRLATSEQTVDKDIESTSVNVDGIITVIKKSPPDDNKEDIKQWLNGVKNNSTKWTRETLEDCLKQPHPLWKLATLEAFLNEREELLKKCFYLETYMDKYETVKAEKEDAEERCKDLTHCLEQMKVEFERLEDYWTGKMDDERKLFEQEQAISTEKYIELELKINEYAELFSKVDEDAEMIQNTSLAFKSINKLPTIDETEMYEKQVLDLEEEFAEYKANMQETLRQKDDVIRELNQALRQLESSTHVTSSPIAKPEVPRISVEPLESCPPIKESPSAETPNSFPPETPVKSANKMPSQPHNTSTNEMPSQPRDVSTNETSSPPTDAAMQSDWSPVAPPTLAPPTKQYADSSVQTSASEIVKALDSAVQTEMFLDEIDSLASKLDPERVSHYERMLNGQTTSPNSVNETPKLHKKMRRHKKNHQRASSQTNNHVNESRTTDLSVGSEEDSLQLELRLHRQNVSRLAASDLLVKDLYVRNCMNMARIHNLERELLVERSKTAALSCK
ncbi:hypothetical protein M8J76_009871 [Diaphorina citri]|nr:hypothetical protein M8J76_009871 [Diaphorina citri]